MDPGSRSLINWIRQGHRFELSLRSLAEAVDVIGDLCGITSERGLGATASRR